jgi:hypothetical protein
LYLAITVDLPDARVAYCTAVYAGDPGGG